MIARAVICVTLAVCSAASWAQTWAVLQPSPVSVAITVGHWIMTRDRREVFEIVVEGRARTFDQARDQAFRLAVEQALGSVVLSNSQAQHQHLVRDEIVSYAAGYVDRFDILARDQTSQGVTVRMRVWVARSQLSQRLLGTASTSSQIDGERLAAQTRTFERSRRDSDRVLNQVLMDYPERAFDVQLESQALRADNQRQTYLDVIYQVSWNQRYLKALGEAVQVVNQRRDCSRWFNCTATHSMVVRTNLVQADPQAWFDDAEAWRTVDQHAVASLPTVMFVFKNSAGQTVLGQCHSVAELDHSRYAPWRFVEVAPQRVTFNGLHQRRLQAKFDLSAQIMQQLDHVEIKVVRAAACPF